MPDNYLGTYVSTATERYNWSCDIEAKFAFSVQSDVSGDRTQNDLSRDM
jgi:hypothetical protein